MTTTVTIKTRGLAANVNVDGEDFTMSPNSEKRIDTDDQVNITVSQAQAEDSPVPGADQNDKLIKEVDPETIKELSSQEDNAGKSGFFRK